MANRDNSGSLGANKRKQGANPPDDTGSATVGGVEYWVSGWHRNGPHGPFTSLAFTPKDKGGAKPAPVRKEPPKSDDFDDDVPF